MSALDSVPPLRGPRPEGAPTVRRKTSGLGSLAGLGPPALTRRSVLGGLVATGTALGFAALGVFPTARRAYAEGYDIYTGPCPSFAENDDCTPGCSGRTIFSEACETSGPHTGFHRNDGVDWTLQPNNCYPGGYDGWLWFYDGACGVCACYVERRCHDGYHRLESGWVKSVCRWNTRCGCPAGVEWPPVGPGEEGGLVSTIQYLLSNVGFPPAEVNGRYDVPTETAVRAFQLANFLTPDGVVDAPTWVALVVPVRRGDRGEAVLAAQRQLTARGYAVPVDGAFERAAEAATRDFQRASGLPVTGVVDESSWRTLTGG